jgi:hypothetical protein
LPFWTNELSTDQIEFKIWCWRIEAALPSSASPCLPDEDKPFLVYTDALASMAASLLLQDGRPIAFWEAFNTAGTVRTDKSF